MIVPLGSLGSRKIADISPAADAATHGRELLATVHRTGRALRRHRVDVVYTNSLKAHVYGGMAARALGLPWIAHIRDILQSPYVTPSVRRGLRFYFSAFRPKAVIANSHATAAAAPINRLAHVIPSGIADQRIQTRAVDQRGSTLGLLGRLEPWKGQHVAVEAVAMLRNEGFEVRLLIGGDAAHGDPAYAGSLKALATTLGVDDSVKFTGFETDPYAFFSRSDLALHTSVLPEPFGQVIVEALATGCPVVASNEGGPVETLRNSGAGLLVAPGQPRILADAIRAALSDPESYAEMSRAAVIRARDFAISRAATDTASVVKSVLS